MRAELNTIVIPLSTVFTRISAAALINPIRRLFEGGAYSSNYCNWQLEFITFRANCYYIRTLLHLGRFITFRPSTTVCVVYIPDVRAIIVHCGNIVT